MKMRSGKWAFPSIALALAGAVLLGPATSARATLTLMAVETGGPTLIAQDGSGVGAATPVGLTTAPDSSVPGDAMFRDGIITLGNLTTAITFGDFSVLGSNSTSNSPGFPTLAQLISFAGTVTNNDSVAHTITLMISDTDFTKPTPPLLGATASGTFNIATVGGLPTGAPRASNVNGNSAHALAFANFSNTLFGTGVTVQDFTFSTDATNLTTASYANNVPNSILGPSTIPYSMTVELIFTIAGGNKLDTRNDTITATAVPEPATLAMVFSALPLIGFAAWRKRRKSV